MIGRVGVEWVGRGVGSALLLWVVAAGAADAPPSAPGTAEAVRLAAQHAHRVEVDDPKTEDPVIFTDISPYTIDEVPVHLPDDQSLQ